MKLLELGQLIKTGPVDHADWNYRPLLSFRKLSANDRALFANDPEDKHPNLNKHKGRATLIVIHSQREIGFSAASATLRSVCSSSWLLGPEIRLQKTRPSLQLNRISDSSARLRSLGGMSHSQIAPGHSRLISGNPAKFANNFRINNFTSQAVDTHTALDAISRLLRYVSRLSATITPPRKVPKPKTASDRKARLKKIEAELDRLYPNVTCALNHENAWQLLAATILSAQCTDERVNKVTPGLFAKFPTIQDMAQANNDEVIEQIRSTGFFNNKAKSLIGAAKRIQEEFHGEVPKNMDDLLTVPGAARKTANVVLGTAFGIASGVVVDTHVQRISQRLDLTRNEDPVKIERDLMKIIDQSRWISFSHQVIHFGRQICVARKPRCAECPLDPICYSADKTLS